MNWTTPAVVCILRFHFARFGDEPDRRKWRGRIAPEAANPLTFAVRRRRQRRQGGERQNRIFARRA